MQMSVNAIGRTVPNSGQRNVQEKILLDEINRFMKMADEDGSTKMMEQEGYIAVPAVLYYSLIAGMDLALFVNAKHPYINNEYVASIGGKTSGRVRNTLKA